MISELWYPGHIQNGGKQRRQYSMLEGLFSQPHAQTEAQCVWPDLATDLV